jgi:recombination protein U
MKNIKYPTAFKTYQKPEVSVKNRGETTEKWVNQANQYYLDTKQAVIHKKPTPVQVVKVDYPKRSAAKISEAYYKTPSTTDYNGVFEGFYVDFDVKETQSLTSFPLSNIHPHQIEHLKQVDEQGGIAFLIIAFVRLDEHFILPFKELHSFVIRSFKGRKSISIVEMRASSLKIDLKLNPTYDYLPVLKQLISQIKKR